MNKWIQCAVILILSTYSFCLKAQDYSISLYGTFQLDTSVSEGIYDALVFDGAGKVDIRSLVDYKGDFLQIGDTVVVYPDKSIFTFLVKDENTLVGIDTWVKDNVFRKMENDTITSPAYNRPPEYAAQFYEFYCLTDKKALDLSTYISVYSDSALQASMKKLCDEGFPKACITLANALMMNSPAMGSLFKNDEEKTKMAPDKLIVDYYIKAIELNELDAIAQLGAYFLILGHQEQAIKVFEKGCELGHKGCCLSLFGLEYSEEN